MSEAAFVEAKEEFASDMHALKVLRLAHEQPEAQGDHAPSDGDSLSSDERMLAELELGHSLGADGQGFPDSAVHGARQSDESQLLGYLLVLKWSIVMVLELVLEWSIVYNINRCLQIARGRLVKVGRNHKLSLRTHGHHSLVTINGYPTGGFYDCRRWSCRGSGGGGTSCE